MITISDFFGWIGVTVSIIFFASPITKYIQLLKKKADYKEINIIIIIGNYISSIVWLIYGFQIKTDQIKVCYSIGSLISLIWIWIYLVQMGKTKMRRTLIFTMILTSSTFALFIVLIGIINDKKVIGEICFIVCSLSYISPTQLLIKVLNSKDYKKIPIYSAIISAVGYFSWSLFGLFNINATIIIPNIVGLGFALAQIILYKVYKDKKPLAEEIGNISTTVIGAMKNVVEKTVEIANSITPENIQENKDNGAAPTNTNTNVEPGTNIEVYNVDNNNFNFNNSVGIKDNSDNNNLEQNNETNNSMNFNTNLETNSSIINQNNNENNINDNENKDIPNV